MSFKIGDAVQLKGGSPTMTVTSTGADAEGRPRLTCTWFDKAGNEKTGAYYPEALQAYTGDVGGWGIT